MRIPKPLRRVCVIVDVDGEPAQAQFTSQPTEEDLEAFPAVVRAVRSRVNGPKP